MIEGGGNAQWRHTALTRAAGHGRVDCLRLLLEFGADKEAQDSVRHTRAISGLCILLIMYSWHAISHPE